MLTYSPIQKILIANRGEIALRILHAARLLHIPAVAVYSEKESGAPWIHHFEESYTLGKGELGDTYLNAEAYISIARKSGADAIHPGYGFLSENYRFASACEENNIRFIGPPSAVLKLMGDKLTAHDFVSSLGIPVIFKIMDSPTEIRKIGHKLEYPLLVKAAAGGGGKGMLLVRSPDELTDALEMASKEAYQYFSDDRVYVEKYLKAPRHIEVQLLGDAHGHVVHLFERECSIQRRHQKIIEEAPALKLPALLRSTIIDAALTIARSVHYINAGTIEFLVEESGDFFFLEMNPRIQVEHVVTEMITGIDLVKEQIRIAEGSPLSFSQSDIHCQGHAIEARIYAEDPESDLMPSPGRICLYIEPVMKHIRMESAVTSGSEVLPDFDPLVAKIIAHGPSRMEAINHLEIALDKLIITGIRHNLPLIRAILKDEQYLRNEVSTTYLQDRSDTFREHIKSRKSNIKATDLVFAAAMIILFPDPNSDPDSVWKNIGYWRMVPLVTFRYGETRYALFYQHTSSNSLEIWYNEHRFRLFDIKVDEANVVYAYDDIRLNFNYIPETNGVIGLALGDLNFEVERCDRYIPQEFDYQLKEESTGMGTIHSPLPGKIIRINVLLNDKVNRGDSLMTIESMKLENSILTPFSGTVEQILTHEGDQVRQHDPLFIIKA